MQADTETTNEVLDALLRYRDTYVQRDLAGVLACFAPDADLFILGTGVDERIVGWETMRKQFQRDWDQSDTIEWEWGWHSDVSSAGPVAWVAYDTVIRARMGSIKVDTPTRLTAVLELRGDRWLIQQLHVSMPAPGQDAGESFPPPR